MNAILSCRKTSSCPINSNHKVLESNNLSSYVDLLEYEVITKRIGQKPNFVYLGIVGAGADIQTWGGHAVLFFSKDKDSISDGIAYHYNFNDIESSDKKGSFIVLEEPAAITIENYREQNRVINLYRINLEKKEHALLKS